MSFATQTGKNNLLAKHDDDVVICGAFRSPVTRARKGGLAQCTPEEFLGVVLKGLIARTGVDPSKVEDVAVGNVLPPGGGATGARQATLWAGIPDTTAVNTINRARRVSLLLTRLQTRSSPTRLTWVLALVLNP